MGNRESGFSRQFFGGFSRKDVVDYISELSAERNRLAEENEKLRDEIDRLQNPEPEDTAPEEASNKTHAEKLSPVKAAAALAEADTLLEELERRYELLRADTAVSASHIRCEMESSAEKLEKLNESLKKTGERIAEIRSGLKEKAAEKQNG